jgi:hypothetical protein
MRITSAGNVGIGTTAPSSLLSLSKTGLVDFQLNASDQATDEKTWVWQAGAPVGVGVYRLRAVNDAYTNGVNAVTFTRSGISSVTATFSSSVEATSFIKTSGTAAQFLKADGTVDSSTYLTANQTITLSGVVTGSGTTAITTAIANGAITNAMLANSSFFVGTTSIDLGRASAAQTLTGVSIDGNAATATNVGWSGVSAGYKENYDLGFRPPNDSSSYAGFKFASPGSDANAGYFLVRGGADSDVYTQNGITLVADLGWLTLAQRTQSDKGIRFMTGTTSTTKMIILNNGNVGIGTTGPTEKLHVAGDGRFEGSLDLGHGSASEYSLEIGASRTGNGFAYVDLIGDTTYPDYGLRMIRNNGGANTSSAITHRGTGILLIETNEAAPIVFNTTAAERMRILSGGNVGIGTTAPQQLLHVLGATDGYMMVQGANDAGNAGIYFKKEDTTGTMDRTKGLILFHSNLGTGYGRGHLGFCLNSADDNTVVSVSDEKFRMVDNGDFLADGDVVAYSTTISDARYKTNIQPIESALDKVNQMRGVSFDWTAVRSGREFGVIAQEIEKIAPEVVSEKELLNGDTMKTVSYTSLVPFLIESIKELTQQVNELKAQLDGLTK